MQESPSEWGKLVDTDIPLLGRSHQQGEKDVFGQQDSNEHIVIAIDVIEYLSDIQLILLMFIGYD